MLCSPVISNVLVTRTLIDGGAGLNVLSMETFNNLQVPYDQLQPTKPFSGVTDGSTVLIGQVCLPITFGACNNYRTELIDFDVAHIRLTYNAILGYSALAKFMAVTHHGYNVLKMPGSGGVITVPSEEKDAVCSLERAFQAASLEDSDRGSRRLPETTPKKKKTSSGSAPQEAGPSGPVSAQGYPPSIAEESATGALLRQGSGALTWRATDLAWVTREARGHHVEACFEARFPRKEAREGRSNQQEFVSKAIQEL